MRELKSKTPSHKILEARGSWVGMIFGMQAREHSGLCD